MTVAYATHNDPHDVQAWSGTAYFIPRALERQGVEVAYVGRLQTPWELVSYAKQAFSRYVLGKQIYRAFEPSLTRAWGRIVAKRLASLHADVVLSAGTPAVADLDTDLPVVVYSDAVFSQSIGHAAFFSNLTDGALRNGERQQRAAFARTAAVVYSSEWAAAAAVRDYGMEPSRVHVVPFGSNLPDPPTRAGAERGIAARAATLGTCRLLLMGVDWHWKGADLAVETAQRLNEAGLPTTLTIAGCLPPDGAPQPPFVHLPGFISKRTEAGRRRLTQLIEEAHFLILPTRAEAFGIVFCEASAYGVPSLTHRIGGIPSAVRDGVNGWTFPLGAGPEVYAQRILTLMRDPAAYAQMARSSRAEYERNLNWDVAGARLKRILEGVVDAHGRR